ncbi:MAG: hypothetical protein HY582_03865 [Candidatus Omnitrophica bacterium]|nr:hypothetical protein [Candidatus Omnitrophota bacterium]
MTDIRTKVAGGVFLLIAILQLVRFLMKAEVVVNSSFVVPVALSGVAAVVFALLGLWMLKPCCKHQK